MKNSTDKLLILGCDSSTKYILDYSKKMGVHTIITDYFTLEQNPLKKLADEAWYINIMDLDILEKKCREENITAVFAGSHELCLEQTRLLAKRLNLPFYATDKAWFSTLNKSVFKNACIEVGLDVPKRYPVSNDTFEEDISKIDSFPLIVKPSDGSASRGISICYNKEDLLAGYQKALQFSENKDIIIEDFIDGKEFNVDYLCDNGKFYPIVICQSHYQVINKDKKFVFLYSECEEYDEYLKNINPKIIKLAENLECKDNMFFVQFIKRGDSWYVIEMNYRLPGVITERIEQELFHSSFVKNALSVALGRGRSFDIPDPKDYKKKVCACYLIYSKPGTINKIEGLDVVKSMGDIDFCLERFKEGDEVTESNNMTQIAYYLYIWADTSQAIKEKLQTINNTLSFKDPNGNEMLIRFEKYEIFK